jgi:hypothetical protein
VKDAVNFVFEFKVPVCVGNRYPSFVVRSVQYDDLRS